MVRSTLAVLIVSIVAGTSQAALIATATRIGGVTGGAAFTANEAAAPGNLNALVNGAADSLWVSYALGVKSTAGEKVSSYNVNLTTIAPAGGFHQRWSFNDDTVAFDVSTPSSLNISSGDSHLVVAGSVVAVAPVENRIAKAGDGATTTLGFTTSHLGEAPGVRNWGIGTAMAGAWGFTAAEQTAQVAGNTVNFAYVVIPRGSEGLLNYQITAQSATTNSNGTPGAGFTFTTQDFVNAGFGIIPEPATMSIVGLALVGFGFIRRRS